MILNWLDFAIGKSNYRIVSIDLLKIVLLLYKI